MKTRVLQSTGRRLRNAWRRSLAVLVDAGLIPTPVPRLRDVQIEINSLCNRKCRYCPNHANSRVPGFLPEDLFKKIIADLAAMRFSGNICFNLFNEPLLDKRLPAFMAHIHAVLPGVRPYLNTNGDFLDMPAWRALRAAGLQYANVTQYDGEISAHIRRLLDQLPPDERARINAHVQNAGELHNWAGKISLPSAPSLPLRRFCDRPFRQLSINYKGKAVLCCSDYFGEVETGDVRTESIPQIWRSEVFARYRRSLLRGRRAGLALCRTCSM